MPDVHRAPRARPRAVEPSLAGPRRPQDRVAADGGARLVPGRLPARAAAVRASRRPRLVPEGGSASTATLDADVEVDHGVGRDRRDHVAARTRRTRRVMVAAGLLAQKAVARGLESQPWVKTSLAPGSRVVTDYLERAGLTGAARRAALQPRRLRLHDLHRQLAARCRTPLADGDRRARPRRRRRCSRATATSRAASTRRCARATSPRRRSSSPTRSPARSTSTSTTSRSAPDRDGEPVYLRDLWPSPEEIATSSTRRSRPTLYETEYGSDLRRRRALAVDAGADGRPVRVGRRLDLRARAAVLPRPRRRAAAARGHRRRPRAGACSATRSRPTTSRPPARSRRRPGRPLPDRARRRAARLQLVRLAARQPRGDDPRHVREHPPAQPARAGHRGRRHGAPAERRAAARSSTPPSATRPTARRSSCSPARSTAPARRATGRPRAPCCSACAP